MPERITTNTTQYKSSSLDIIYRNKNTIHTNPAKQMWSEHKQSRMSLINIQVQQCFQMSADQNTCDFTDSAALST
jgi:hypothetical protein